MESSAVAVLARTAECAALLFIGYKLRSAQLFSATDAEVSQRLEGAAELSFSIVESPLNTMACCAGRSAPCWLPDSASAGAALLQCVSGTTAAVAAYHSSTCIIAPTA